MKRYKLTTRELTTHNGFQWEIGKEVKTDGSGDLCSKVWLHCYTSPLLAVLLNPIHANISNPRIWSVFAGGDRKEDKGLKEGFTRMKLVKEIELPKISINQKIAFAILCSIEVYKDESYNKWANNWLTGLDRTSKSAYAAYATDYATDYAADNAADNAADYAADYAADNAAYAADNAAYAAYAADNAAYAADINFISIAKKAMKYS